MSNYIGRCQQCVFYEHTKYNQRVDVPADGIPGKCKDNCYDAMKICPLYINRQQQIDNAREMAVTASDPAVKFDTNETIEGAIWDASSSF